MISQQTIPAMLGITGLKEDYYYEQELNQSREHRKWYHHL